MIAVSDFVPHTANTMRGTFKAHLPSGMTLHACVLHVGPNGPWISPPGRPKLMRGELMRKTNGKPDYEQVITFEAGARERFQAATLTALRETFPEALRDA